MSDSIQLNKNPLSAFFRQPKLFVSLPSKGEFYPEGSLEKVESNEYPVYPMTARDEIMFKTPDALMNGASTVEVIKSCIPNIKDPWKMPSIDVDVLLCAIRAATYGNNMDVSSNCPKCNHENDRVIDLRLVIANLSQNEFVNKVEIGSNMVIHLRPMGYDELSKTALKALEHQRVFSIVNDEAIPEDEKLTLVQASFVKLTDLSLDIVADCIASIESSAGNTDNHEFIREFLKESEKSVFNQLNDAITSAKEKYSIPALETKCDECGHEYKLELSMDQSDFFGKGF